MTNDQIKKMAERFLGWKLPSDFHPDGGISFDQVRNEGTPQEHRCEPVGTNLLTMSQAEDMVRHMLSGISDPFEAPAPARSTSNLDLGKALASKVADATLVVIKPGDSLAVLVPVALTRDQREIVSEHLRDQLQVDKVAILDHGMKLAVIRDETKA